MSKSARRPQQLFSVVMWILSIIFAGFLIGFGSLIIRDLPRVDKSVSVEQFMDQGEITRLKTAENQQSRLIRTIERNIEDASSTLQSARNDYNSAKTSLDNWLSTRTATESSAQNPEVIRRTRSVEDLQKKSRDALRQVEDLNGQLTEAERAKRDINVQRNDLRSAARPEYRRAQNAQELRVFLYRLALTLPLLLIGGWLLAKKRESAYWPLFRGFVLFALFAFFVELVPYLPSYGGYVRFAVGIILVAVAGHFLIRGMRRYLERKKVEESRSESERRGAIEYETALKKISAKTCPGCDRSIITREGVDTDFCVHCGIRLQEKCGACDHRNISFHRFCLSCGTPSESHTGPDEAIA